MPRDATGISAGPPRAPTRAMRVIEALAVRPDGLALAELGRDLGLPKTSLFSMLRALESEAYVENAGGVYRLGPAALRLGALIGGGDTLERKLSPLLAPVVKKAEETVLLAVPTEDHREVRGDRLIVEREGREELEVPMERVCDLMGDQVLLSVPGSRVDQQGWESRRLNNVAKH